MELMKGYEETTVGVIPSDWQVVPITSLIEKNSRITYGVVQRGKDDPRGVDFIRGGDVYDGRIDEENLRKIPHSVDAQYSRTKLCGGELLISLVGFPGECAIVPVTLKGANIARQVALARLDKGLDFEPDFICHFLRSSIGKKLLLREAFGSAQQVINLKDVNKLELPLPSLLEQRDIATALSDVDALIAGLEKLIAKKRDLKQAAMQQLLTGQTRLPGFSGEWKVSFLGDVCRITTGAKDVNEGNPEGQYPFFTCSRAYTFSDAYSFDTEAILIAGNGEVGNLHYFNGKFEAYQRTYVLCDFTAHVGFLWHQLSANLAASLGLGKVGSSIPYIKKSNLTGFQFMCPSAKDEQAEIAAILSEMDEELSALESRLAKTRELKEGMMQELLTGRIRLV